MCNIVCNKRVHIRSNFISDERAHAGGSDRRESDRDGLRLRAYTPFPPAGAGKERDLGPEGPRTPENEEKRVHESPAHEEAA